MVPRAPYIGGVVANKSYWGARKWLLVLGLAMIMGPTPALARWPTPAGGESTSGAPEILLTFDDGPHEKYTPRILDALAQYRVRAVFFWVGHRIRRTGRRSQMRQELVGRAIREGHLIANHTINHVHLCKVSRNQAEREIDGNARLYEDATGLPMILFRAPYGDHCRRLLRMLSDRQLEHLHWDIDAREWRDRDGKYAANRVIRKLQKLQGRAIILFHDTKAATPIAVPLVLQWIVQENRRRHEENQPQIRILNGSDFVAERFQNTLMHWFKAATSTMTNHVVTSIAQTIP